MIASAETVKNLRIKMKLEIKQFANLLGVTYGAVKNYENGIRTPKLEIIAKMKSLAKIKGVRLRLDDFLDE